jgi:hypothetical protein
MRPESGARIAARPAASSLLSIKSLERSRPGSVSSAEDDGWPLYVGLRVKFRGAKNSRYDRSWELGEDDGVRPDIGDCSSGVDGMAKLSWVGLRWS